MNNVYAETAQRVLAEHRAKGMLVDGHEELLKKLTDALTVPGEETGRHQATTVEFWNDRNLLTSLMQRQLHDFCKKFRLYPSDLQIVWDAGGNFYFWVKA